MAADPEHMTIVQMVVGLILGAGTLGGTIFGLILSGLYKQFKQVETENKRIEVKFDEAIKLLDEKKTNNEYCQTYHKAMEDKIDDGSKQFEDLNSTLKGIEKSQTRLLRRQDRMTICLGLIAQKYGVVMPEEEKEV